MAGELKDAQADSFDQAPFLGDGDEHGGRKCAVNRVLPAHQCFGTDHAAAVGIEDRLVGGGERPILERCAQVLFDGSFSQNNVIEFMKEDLVALPPSRLRLLKGDVGLSQQI